MGFNLAAPTRVELTLVSIGFWSAFQCEGGSSKAHFTLGVEAEGRGESRDLIGWELKANPKRFRAMIGENRQLVTNDLVEFEK